MAKQQTPNSPDAERAVLGSLLISPGLVRPVQGLISSADFYDDRNAQAFSVIVQAAERGAVDIIAIGDILEQRGQDKSQWLSYLAGLMSAVPTGIYAEYYAGIIKRQATRRKLIEIATRLVADTLDADEDTTAETIISTYSKQLADLMAANNDDSLLLGADTVRYLEEKLAQWQADEASDNRKPRFPLKSLEYLIPNLEPGELLCVAAESSVGKTALAETLAEYWAWVEKRKVVYIHPELSHSRMLMRRLARNSNVPIKDLSKGNYSEQAREAHRQIAQWAGRMQYVYCPGRAIDWVIGKCEELYAKELGQIFILDYLQIITDSPYMARDTAEQRAARKVAAFKDFISRRECYGVLLSQVNRSEEGQEVKSAKSLRDSGQIFEKCNVVLHIYRKMMPADGDDGYGNALKAGERSPVAKLQVMKNTNGATGTAHALFQASKMKFEDVDIKTEPLPRF